MVGGKRVPAGASDLNHPLSLHPGPLPAFGHVLVCELAFPLACAQASVHLGPAARLHTAVPLSNLGGCQGDPPPKVPSQPEQDWGHPQAPAASPVPVPRHLCHARIPATTPQPVQEGPPDVQDPTVTTGPEQDDHVEVEGPTASSPTEHRDRGEMQALSTALHPERGCPLDVRPPAAPAVPTPGSADVPVLSPTPEPWHEGHLDGQSPAHPSPGTQPVRSGGCKLPPTVCGHPDNPLRGAGSSQDHQITASSPVVGHGLLDTLLPADYPLLAHGDPLDCPAPTSAPLPPPQDLPDVPPVGATPVPPPPDLVDIRVPVPQRRPKEGRLPESQAPAVDPLPQEESPIELQAPKLASSSEQGGFVNVPRPVTPRPLPEHGGSHDTQGLASSPAVPTLALSRPGHLPSPVARSESSDFTPPHSPPLPTRQLLGPNAAALSRYLAASYISQSLARRQGPGGDILPAPRGPWSSSAPTSRAPSPPPQPQPPPPPARRLSYATTVSIHVGGGGRLRPAKAQVRLNHPALLAPAQDSGALRQAQGPSDAPFHT